MDADGETVGLINNYEKTYGNLVFTKTVSGGVTKEESEGALKFKVEKLNENGDVIGYLKADGSISDTEVELTIKNDGFETTDGGVTYIKTFEGIDLGKYRVIETNALIDGYRFESSNSVTSAETTVTKDTAGAANLTDVYTALGNLTFTKTVSGGVTKEEAEGALKFEVRKLDDKGNIIGYLDKDGNLVKNAVQLTIKDGFVTSDGGKTYTKTFNGIETGSYKIVETNAAIDGYIFEESQSVTETSTTVEKNTTAAADLKDVYTKQIRVSKVDITTQKELEGAHIVVLDKDGNIVDEWDSTTAPHIVKNVKAGETYTLRETVAPKGYSVTADTTFSIDKDGKVTYSGNTRTSDGVLLVEDALAQKGMGQIRVTKYTLKNNGAFKVVSQTFYTALFSDQSLTKRVSDIKPIVLTNAYTNEVTFNNLQYGTYFVAETDATGKPMTSSSTVTRAEISNGTCTLNGANPSANAIIKNTMKEGVLGAYVSVDLNIRKNVVDKNGKAKKVKDTFYFAVFSDAAFTKRISDTQILAINLKNKSSGAATFRSLPYSDEIYVAEVDKNGNVIGGTKGFNYTVSYSANGLSYGRADGGTVTVTNKKTDGGQAGVNRGKAGENGTNGTAPAVRTGDQTPILPMLVTMLVAAAAAIFLVFARRRMKKHQA